MEPLNKGHLGDSSCFVEKLSSFKGSQCIKTIGKVIFVVPQAMSFAINIQCSCFGGSTIGDSAVLRQ